MTQNLAQPQKLLRFYPKAYREERGEEIVATLQEAAEARVPRVSLSDQISVALYGVRIRLGLTSETMFGKALDIAAIPGLVMGAFFGVYLLISGDLPVVHSDFFYPHFGPFLTVGPLLYLVWILGVVVVFEWPQYRRRIAGVCMTLTIVGELLAKLAHRNPTCLGDCHTGESRPSQPARPGRVRHAAQGPAQLERRSRHVRDLVFRDQHSRQSGILQFLLLVGNVRDSATPAIR
jgi:hypothetical protein